MLFSTAIGSKWKDRGKRAVRAALTIAVLSAVAVVGISLLGSDVLAAWKTAGNAEQSFVSSGSFEGLFNFEAPAATVEKFKAASDEATQARIEFSASTPLKSWKFTLSAIQQLALELEFLAALETLQVQFNAYNFVLNNPFSPFVAFVNNFALTFTQTATNLILALSKAIPGLPPPPIPPPYHPPSGTT